MTHIAPTRTYDLFLLLPYSPLKLLQYLASYVTLSSVNTPEGKHYDTYDRRKTHATRNSETLSHFSADSAPTNCQRQARRRAVRQAIPCTCQRLREVSERAKQGQIKNASKCQRHLSVNTTFPTRDQRTGDAVSILLPVASIHDHVRSVQGVCVGTQRSGRKSVDMTTRLFTHPTSLTLAPFARQTGGAA